MLYDSRGRAWVNTMVVKRFDVLLFVSCFAVNDPNKHTYIYIQNIQITWGIGSDLLIVFLDIHVSKAFDRVYHNGLVYKLEQFGIRGKLLGWFRIYL